MRWSLVWAAFKKSFYSRNYLINISALNERCIQDLALLYEPNKRWGEPLSRAVFNNWPDLVVFIPSDVLVFHDQFVTFVRWSLVSCPGFGLRVIRRRFERPSDHPVLCRRAGASLSAEKQPPQQIFRSWRGLVDPESLLNHSVLAVFHGWCVLNVVLIDLLIYWFSQLGSSGSNCATSLFSAVRMRTGLRICLQISWARLNA